MKAPRIALSATAAVVAAVAALTFAAPALAAGAVPARPSAADSTTNSTATLDDDEDELNDLRVAIAQLISLPQAGSEVEEKGRAALHGTIEDMRAFLDTGYRLAQAQDDRVALAQLYSKPDTSPEVKAAVRTILRTSDPEEMRWFLEVGQYEIDQ
ncbi:ALF repeat-containing protein [Streptomyces sp. LRE541]|uniref:ALF repeat-containing protein n=1 Tax=Streptomyces sp. LRE541 TaxID=2931983 RepID=UPI00200CFA82|nr:ALF repeat-containing protein [Streptomyces sp. LRE541]UPZ26680.1 ALF repeat-containing protein [Streptomyces sp. LRE541]